jgi:hypothetical protein
MKQMTTFTILLCFLLAMFQIAVFVFDAQGQTSKNSDLTLFYEAQSSDYSYSDDFSTRKAEMDSYQHSPFVDSLPLVFLYGLLVYMPEHRLGFFKGWEVDAGAFLGYRFPLDGELGIITGGMLDVVVYSQTGGGSFSICKSWNSKDWECFQPGWGLGHFELTPLPEDSCTSLYLSFSGDSVLLDSFSIQLTFSDGSCVEIQDFASPGNFELSQNYPNPFNQATKIEFTLSKSGFVTLQIYDILGRKVRTLVSELQPSGNKSVFWDGKNDAGKDVASGIYFYQLRIGDFCEAKKMLLLK